MLSEVFCPDISSLANVILSEQNYSVGAVIEIQCVTNLKFLNGETKQTIVCQRNGKWNGTVSSCAG